MNSFMVFVSSHTSPTFNQCLQLLDHLFAFRRDHVGQGESVLDIDFVPFVQVPDVTVADLTV